MDLKNIKYYPRIIKSFLLARFYYLYEMVYPSQIKTAYEIPIIINNFNRLTMLKRLISDLELRGYRNIYIIDNNSTYEPLIEFYDACPYQVFRLTDNLGARAFYKSGIYKDFYHDFYVCTDPDLAIVSECPNDFMDYFWSILKNYKFARKVGFSLRLDNIPDHYPGKQKVIEWEQKYFKRINCDGLYRASIDCTFALHRPHSRFSRSRWDEMYRTPFPYQMEHLPWYSDYNNLSNEDKYYIEQCKLRTSWTRIQKMND